MWLELQIFGFRALWSPYYLLFVLVLSIVYFIITGPKRKQGESKPTTFQQVMFYSGMVLLYIIKGAPIDLMAHIMFTAHMIQMALYYLLFPLLVIKGIPVWIWKKVFDVPVLSSVLRLLTRPLISLLLFNGLFSIYHMPDIFDYAKSSEIAHAVITTVILFTAFCMWLAVYPPIEETDRMSPILKIGFIFANGVLITPACGLIIFSGTPLYDTYSQSGAWLQAMSLCVPTDVLAGLSNQLSGPEYFTSMPITQDQQLGGIIMKVTQEIIFGAIIAHIFFSWFNRERDTIDPLPTHVQTDT
ncbi:cytochrome c oxidase assembly factor CtaG [Halobacillus amylolyticus]|uniref:Cytochrome c oxidase assembly factor CtaG n=1 Tax=Halobacillus amylolyticus TaxID=2932259 RepID=A0ABY4HDJ9_9BACI|nr:cytochrome c oxidase assembly factor CtaG [Halobacillus amylolyticus]UOR12953.1 cytochrome c oxidase assembly factor CtaG [Halobacillus amylolyticus]